MKLIASLALSLALLGGLAACAKEPPAAAPQTTAAEAKAGQTWICPMDKEVVSDKPADCPKCGMKLELKK